VTVANLQKHFQHYFSYFIHCLFGGICSTITVVHGRPQPGGLAVVKTLGKKQRNAVNFWVRFSITPILFQCFELGQQSVLD